MTRAKRRWLPALLIPLALVLAVLTGSVQAGATVSLPPKTADEVLAMIARTQVRAFSGTLQQTAELGLPDIPSSTPGVTPGAGTALEFLAGSHTARVFVGDPTKARLQIMDAMAERDLIVNGKDAWFYNSADNSATHLQAPKPGAPTETLPSKPAMPTPEALANRFLAAVDAGTEVTVGEASSVAGRSAYRLSLAPKDPGTLVASVSIDVDSETGFPLGVHVQAKNQADPAYSLAFTDLSLTAPDPGLFQFTPPAGSTVTTKVLPARLTPVPDADSSPKAPSPHGTRVSGEGWGSIVMLPAAAVPAGLTSNPQISQVLQSVSGGRALTSSLVSVLILDDGRVLAGLVPLERLQSAAAAQ
ncbi:DUF2092 domain-containing protein [Paenarthrobacter sp. AR 02]|uniref:LolA family protein n=1 Tax=Paenarthrobacter sp. AR 02 TaxID=2899821 RepID=UPI001F239D1E|nr:DUF2092 domain-containing protein [Paenarthrobacter sp. AR 02]MCF3141163.1 DUF2092 domain-containing protein [Paenarthrobacter sp. AR 02]